MEQFIVFFLTESTLTVKTASLVQKFQQNLYVTILAVYLPKTDSSQSSYWDWDPKVEGYRLKFLVFILRRLR